MQKLDKYQLEAVKKDGNVLLIAGAGSGKTFTIIKKIEYLINNNICKDKEILVISFTNKSVDDLRKKIKYNINIMTFHKLAMYILAKRNINYHIANDNHLEYITNEFFYTINNNLKKEILNFFKEYDYDIFLKSIKYKNFINIIINIIKIYKTNNCTINDFLNIYNKDNFLSKYIYIIMNLYNQELKSQNMYDFDDLIINATNNIDNSFKYKYIFIDEFQDTSIIRFNLIKKLKDITNASLFVVGDDYQSIYHFSGCNINLFLNYTKLIDNASCLKLKYTYRNSQELIDICKKFIMKNKKQINKDLISNIHLKNPIKIIYYINPKKAFNKLYKKLHGNVLVLGRNNNDIYRFTDNNVNYMTIHSSKGLEADNIIIINLYNNIYGFPNKIVDNKLLNELHPKDKEIMYAEERRLFYVALTRTKNYVYLLVPFFNKSCFIKELKKIMN